MDDRRVIPSCGECSGSEGDEVKHGVGKCQREGDTRGEPDNAGGGRQKKDARVFDKTGDAPRALAV